MFHQVIKIEEEFRNFEAVINGSKWVVYENLIISGKIPQVSMRYHYVSSSCNPFICFRNLETVINESKYIVHKGYMTSSQDPTMYQWEHKMIHQGIISVGIYKNCKTVIKKLKQVIYEEIHRCLEICRHQFICRRREIPCNNNLSQ